MKQPWDDILNADATIDPQKLLDYLEGRLDDKEKHAVEAMLADSPFLDDALEGLGNMKDKQKIAAILQELNHHLRHNAQSRNRRGGTKKLSFPGWLLFATVTIILLAVIGFIIYKMLMTPAA
jgi:anti-sigma factor RsiW